MTDGPGVTGTPTWERRQRGWQGPAEGSVKDPSLVARGKCCRKVKKRIGGGGGGGGPTPTVQKNFKATDDLCQGPL